MADFTVGVTVGGVSTAWVDTATPPRNNPFSGKPHMVWRVPFGAPAVRYSCTVGGVYEPLDSNPVMAGRTFKWSWVESPYPPPAIHPIAGKSSAVAFGSEMSLQEGHYLLLAWLEDAGSVAVPVLVESP